MANSSREDQTRGKKLLSTRPELCGELGKSLHRCVWSSEVTPACHSPGQVLLRSRELMVTGTPQTQIVVPSTLNIIISHPPRRSQPALLCHNAASPLVKLGSLLDTQGSTLSPAVSTKSPGSSLSPTVSPPKDRVWS